MWVHLKTIWYLSTAYTQWKQWLNACCMLRQDEIKWFAGWLKGERSSERANVKDVDANNKIWRKKQNVYSVGAYWQRSKAFFLSLFAWLVLRTYNLSHNVQTKEDVSLIFLAKNASLHMEYNWQRWVEKYHIYHTNLPGKRKEKLVFFLFVWILRN